MDFQLNEEQELFRHSVAEFVDKKVVPVAAKIDEEGQFPFASYGFAMEYDVQRYFRDARLLLLGGGTSETLRTIISRQMDCERWPTSKLTKVATWVILAWPPYWLFPTR